MALNDLSFSSEDFRGVARLFPLPNLVVFPHVMQPLHIFEPRYREMLEDALTGDQLIAMATLEPGYEKEYAGRPPLRPIACLCRVATHSRKEDGTYNILILGLRRVEIVQELPPDRLFREAQVRIIEDVYPPGGDTVRPVLQKKLVAAFKKVLPSLAEAQGQLDQLLSDQIALGMLTDIIGYTLNLGPQAKENLLVEPDVDRRAILLLQELGSPLVARRSNNAFPPDFSVN